MKDEVAPSEETCPQMPVISSGPPEGGRAAIQRRKGRGQRRNQHHSRLIPERTPVTIMQPVRLEAGNEGPGREGDLPRCRPRLRSLRLLTRLVVADS